MYNENYQKGVSRLFRCVAYSKQNAFGQAQKVVYQGLSCWSEIPTMSGFRMVVKRLIYKWSRFWKKSRQMGPTVFKFVFFKSDLVSICSTMGMASEWVSNFGPLSPSWGLEAFFAIWKNNYCCTLCCCRLNNTWYCDTSSHTSRWYSTAKIPLHKCAPLKMRLPTIKARPLLMTSWAITCSQHYVLSSSWLMTSSKKAGLERRASIFSRCTYVQQNINR